MNSDNKFESHKVVINDRRSAEFTGINDVISFDDASVTANSALGDMIIEGEELKVDNFSSEKGILTVFGKINGIYYFDRGVKKRLTKKRNGDQ